MGILLCFLGIFTLTMFLTFQGTKIYRREKENQLIQAYMVSLQSFYTMIQNRIEITRRYRHDLAKHIQTLQILLQKKEQLGLREYAENLEMQYRKLKGNEYCRDEVINTIVSIKRQQCMEKKIPFSIQIMDVEYDLVKDIDMVGLLYNLLDNALEANEKIADSQQRGIWLSMDRKGREIRIEVKNHVAADNKVNFKSEKKEKEDHGLGLKIVDYLVHKYKGKKRIQVDKESRMVTINIELVADE